MGWRGLEKHGSEKVGQQRKGWKTEKCRWKKQVKAQVIAFCIGSRQDDKTPHVEQPHTPRISHLTSTLATFHPLLRFQLECYDKLNY